MAFQFKGEPETGFLTMEMAEKHRALPPLERDRKFKKSRMNYLRECAVLGNLRTIHWGIAWCEATKQWYRLNGQHTAVLFTLLDPTTLTCRPRFYLEKFHCGAVDDMIDIWETYDSAESVRTKGERFQVYVGTEPRLAHFTVKRLTLTANAVEFYRSPEKTPSSLSTLRSRAQGLLSEVPFALWAWSMTGGDVPHLSMCRYPVVAAMLATHKCRPSRDLNHFWTEVRITDTPEKLPRNPTITQSLAYFLRTHHPAGNNKKTGTPVSSRHMFIQTLKHWNAYRAGETKVTPYTPAESIPVVR